MPNHMTAYHEYRNALDRDIVVRLGILKYNTQWSCRLDVFMIFVCQH